MIIEAEKVSYSGTDPGRTLRAGIVGLGLAGGLMVAAIKDCPGVEVIGAAEPDAGVRERFEKDEGVPAYASVNPLIERTDIDFIYVATPHQCHREHAIAAIRHGKHVIVEKPMALSLDDCDAMIAAAEEAGVWLIVGHTHGFDPAILMLRDMIEDGIVGSLKSLAMWNYTDFLYRPRRPEELDTNAGGGIIFNQIPHQLDIARSLAMSPIRSIRAHVTRLDPDRPTEGGCQAIVEFQSGAAATIVYSGYDRFDSDELHGWVSEGGYPKAPAHGRARRRLETVKSPGEEQARRRSDFGYGASVSVGLPPHQPHFGLLVATCEHADVRQSADGLWIYDEDGAREAPVVRYPWRPGRGDLIEEMRRAIVDGRPPVHDGRFGRATVQATLALLQSARERCEILLDEEKA